MINRINENIIFTRARYFPFGPLCFLAASKTSLVELERGEEKEKEARKKKEEEGAGAGAGAGDRDVATVLYIASISFADVDVFTKNGIPRRAK